MKKPKKWSNRREIAFSYFVRYRNRSLRRAQKHSNIPQCSIYDVLVNRLYMFLYKLQVAQKLEDRSCKARAEFAQWCLRHIQKDASLLNKIIYSDECVFHVDGRLNKHNVRIWGTENPHERRKVARDSESYMCGEQCL